MIRLSSGLVLLWLAGPLLGGCAAREPAAREAESGAEHGSAAAESVLTGWFHIVWNGEPLWYLVEADGESVALLRDERLTEPYGGALALNGKRVRVTGEVISRTPLRVRASSIRPEEEGR